MSAKLEESRRAMKKEVEEKMTPKLARAVIEALYANLEAECDRAMETNRLEVKAFQAARQGEVEHRQGGGFGLPRRAGYRNSIDTAARYFVVKWFLDPVRINSAAAASAVRLDCLYASALAELLKEKDFVLGKAEDRVRFALIDYAKHIAAP